MTNSIAEVVDADVVLVLGSNTTEAHPVIGAQIRQAVKRGAKLVVAEPREIPLVEDAHIFLKIKPGTNIALLNGLMHVIISEGLYDRDYVENRTEGFEDLWEVVQDYPPEKVAEICGVDVEDLKEAARLYAQADKAPIFYAMGVTQHSTGTAGVMSISNLALLCGKVGKYGCGVNPLRGQNNVQGACDMGCLPGDYTGYQKVANPEARAKFERAWGVKLPEKPGLTVTEAVKAIEDGRVRCLFVMGENPLLSDPNLNHTEEAFRKLDLLIVQDIFLTETAELAHVVLPAACFAEKEGTFTNTERRVQRIRRAVSPPGEARTDWEILDELMRRLGYENNLGSPEETLREIASLTPSYGGFSFQRLDREQPQWPCPTPDHPGTPILHVGRFSRGERALFKPAHYVPPAEQPDEEYPLLLTTGRILYHYHTRTMTGRNAELNRIAGRSFVEINPADAERLGLQQGARVRVKSRRGEVVVDAVVTDRVDEGVIFIPFHFADGAANRLTNDALDPIAKIPEYKVCAARVERC